MTVQQELASLEELQKLDLENFKIRNELKKIPQTIEETREDVDLVRKILDREKDRLNESEAWRKERQGDIEFQNEMLTKSKAKLQSARNEKENKAATREIDGIRKTIQEREKEAIELMEAIEQYRVAIAEHTKEFAELEENLKKTEQDGQKRIAKIEAQIAKTADERKSLASKVPQKLLRLYERIHKRIGLALVEVTEGSCQGCNMSLPPQMYNELQRCEKLFQCPACYRLLIFKETEEPEDDEA